MQTTTREWIHQTVDKLPEKDAEQLKDYLEFLVWRSKDPVRTGKPKHILEAINKSYDMTMEDAEALLQAIKEGEIPVSFESPFDESEKES